MRESLLPIASPLWTDVLRGLQHDIYHLPGYAALCSRIEGGEPRAFIASEDDDTLFIPLIIRRVPSRLCGGENIYDATVPYGYPGPLVSAVRETPGAGGFFLDRALGALMSSLREQCVVSAFFRLHPLLPLDTEPLRRFGSVVQSGETVAIDLTLPEDAIWQQMRSNHRRDITKSLARGEMAEVDPAWSGQHRFVHAYQETMTRVGAASYYFFTDDYFDDLRVALGEHVHLWIVRTGLTVIAGAVFTERNGIVQYHLGGTLNDALPSNPLKLLFWRAATWFKERGNRWLHLGGGLGGANDSLMHFKRGFSPRTFPFHTWRVVVNAEMYDELLTRAGRKANPGAPAAAYFPAYRELVRA
jgi:hypothetical protein